MSEKNNICEIIKNKISRSDELSDQETLHAEKCPACLPIIEDAMNAVSASAHQKIRALQKIEAAPELISRPARNFNVYKLSTVFALLLVAVLLIPHKNIESENSINKRQPYDFANIDISFPELSYSNFSNEVNSYFKKQSEIIDESFITYTTNSIFSEYDNALSDISLDSIAQTFKLPENGEDKYSSLFSTNDNSAFENISMESID
ncbi:MAG TPA: hypothetical protein PKK26_10540 [Candidatus Wallbacteria bacterium]|nr:hypothetical protein [Candidatus Wallbacteria bacterium]